MENFNRLNDLYFKKLLGDKKRKNLTLSFLHGVLNKDDKNYFTKCERKAPKCIYGDISSLKNNDSISLFFIVLYF